MFLTIDDIKREKLTNSEEELRVYLNNFAKIVLHKDITSLEMVSLIIESEELDEFLMDMISARKMMISTYRRLGPMKNQMKEVLRNLSKEYLSLLIRKKSKGKLLEQERNVKQEIQGTLSMLEDRISVDNMRVLKFILLFKDPNQQIRYMDKIIKIISE